MELIRYNLNEKGLFQIVFNSVDLEYPDILLKDTFKANENDLFIVNPFEALYNEGGTLLSPLYVVDLELAYTLWGYCNCDAIIVEIKGDKMNLWIFPASKPVAHAICCDFINQRYDKEKKRLLSLSNSKRIRAPKNEQ